MAGCLCRKCRRQLIHERNVVSSLHSKNRARYGKSSNPSAKGLEVLNRVQYLLELIQMFLVCDDFREGDCCKLCGAENENQEEVAAFFPGYPHLMERYFMERLKCNICNKRFFTTLVFMLHVLKQEDHTPRAVGCEIYALIQRYVSTHHIETEMSGKDVARILGRKRATSGSDNGGTLFKVLKQEVSSTAATTPQDDPDNPQPGPSGLQRTIPSPPRIATPALREVLHQHEPNLDLLDSFIRGNCSTPDALDEDAL